MNKEGFIIAGMLIYLVTSIVNRFFVTIPDAVYIPLAVVGIVLMIAGIRLGKNQAKADKENQEKE